MQQVGDLVLPCNTFRMLIIPPQTKLGGYTGVTLSVCLCVMKSCPGHNFKLHTQIGHIVETCSVQEP